MTEVEKFLFDSGLKLCIKFGLEDEYVEQDDSVVYNKVCYATIIDDNGETYFIDGGPVSATGNSLEEALENLNNIEYFDC